MKKAKKFGRPTKYKRNFPQKLIEFFDIEPFTTRKETFYYKNGDYKEKDVDVANTLPTIEGFCRTLKITKPTFHDWVSKYKDFSYAYKRAKEIQQEIWITNSIKGLYSQPFAIFAGKNMFGWKDKSEVDQVSRVFITEKEPK